MEGSVRSIFFAIFIIPTVAKAQGVFYSYGHWEQMPPQLRAVYVAGVIDSLSSIATPDQAKSAIHYSACVQNSGMNSGQID
jgi:hypothetical protein